MFFSRRISSSRFLVSALGCGLASFSALEIALVSEWTRRVSRFLRIDRAVFLHRFEREGDPRPMRQKRAQLRAKCESAPLRRSVTERAMRSTPKAQITLRPRQVRARQAQPSAFFRVRGEEWRSTYRPATTADK